MTFEEFLAKTDFLVEGIDVDASTKTVTINNTHNSGVITNPLKLTSTTINGIKIYSVFRRLKGDGDGNPMIKALKNIDGWKLSSEDSYDIDNIITELSKTLDYDVVVLVASSNNYLEHFSDLVSNNTPVIRDFFSKVKALDVHLDCSVGFSPKETELLKVAYSKMKEMNKGIFSFKYVPNGLRSRFSSCSEITSINYSQEINDKRILVVDDTITSGSTISQSIDGLLSIYDPKSITVLTAFSKLY